MKHLYLLLTLCLSPALAGEAPHGFIDLRGGTRLQDDAYERDASLGELRLQLEWNHLADLFEFQLRADGLYDDLADDHSIDLDRGQGALDLRESWLMFSPNNYLDIKLGRQIITWGTGDLLFINDLFPKDWQSFFSGREVSYLKAPSDALMVSAYPGTLNINLVYTPEFDADRYLTGERTSLYNPMLGRISGRDAIVQADHPDGAELALRLSGNRGSTEWAIYGYDGYWKSPGGFDPILGKATFPELRVYGMSLRGPFAGGIINGEAGYYDSRQDPDGIDPLVPNSEVRFLLGFEKELISQLTGAFQFYYEDVQDVTSFPGGPPVKEDRQVVTARFTKMAMKDNLIFSLFTYISPTDDDGYSRPHVSYKVDDHWTVGLGGNIFWGKEQYTFFGQFEDNSNVYASLRYAF